MYLNRPGRRGSGNAAGIALAKESKPRLIPDARIAVRMTTSPFAQFSSPHFCNKDKGVGWTTQLGTLHPFVGLPTNDAWSSRRIDPDEPSA